MRRVPGYVLLCVLLCALIGACLMADAALKTSIFADFGSQRLSKPVDSNHPLILK